MKSLRLLLIEDSEDDAMLLELELRNGGLDTDITRVETPEELESALEAKNWDAVIADYSLPAFTGIDALRIIRARGLDLPFILVSGVIGEEKAVEAMKAGAHDYILKGSYSRLAPALERELEDAAVRRERREAVESLRLAYAEMEQRVAERTSELAHFNEVLQAEIAERERVENELLKAKEAAEAANLAKSQFLANMSHELRTPMSGVLGMLDLVLSDNFKGEQREYIKYIKLARTSANSMVLILNDILDLTKIEAGILSIEEKPFSIRSCLENTINVLLPIAKNKGLSLNLTVSADVPETLIGDKTRFNQVLSYLGGNALKFTEKGKVEVHVATSGYTPGGKREVTVTVTDTGIGIPEDKQSLIFQTFSQVDDSHTRSYGGTGLGLAISKEIIERMGGTISFTSEEGKGSTFFCTIPFGEAGTGVDDSIAPEEAAPTAALLQPGETTKPRLLIAEDDPTIRQVLGTMLQLLNFEIDFAENGQLAVEMWERGNYDLILMDVQMPRMNGFEATAAIREIERTSGGHIPIVAMTAHALKTDEEKCLDAGMDAYVSKPIDFKKTVEVIKESLKKAGTF
ncbi:MAG TPA: response regulator [Dongiaceae bacterium]|nr:response regulator [Dongiaceae bacterium]